jgi:hypothetical protein
MRHLAIIILLFFTTAVNGQAFVNYQDTVNHFSIDIPVGWRYGIPKNNPQIKLMAYRTPLNANDTSKDNFNINIFKTPNIDLSKTYLRFFHSLISTENFKLIDSGTIVLNNKQFKWLIETHQDDIAKIQIHNYDFITYQNNMTYILTLVTFSDRFEALKPTFKKIANSLKLAD